MEVFHWGTSAGKEDVRKAQEFLKRCGVDFIAHHISMIGTRGRLAENVFGRVGGCIINVPGITYLSDEEVSNLVSECDLHIINSELKEGVAAANDVVMKELEPLVKTGAMLAHDNIWARMQFNTYGKWEHMSHTGAWAFQFPAPYSPEFIWMDAAFMRMIERKTGTKLGYLQFELASEFGGEADNEYEYDPCPPVLNRIAAQLIALENPPYMGIWGYNRIEDREWTDEGYSARSAYAREQLQETIEYAKQISSFVDSDGLIPNAPVAAVVVNMRQVHDWSYLFSVYLIGAALTRAGIHYDTLDTVEVLSGKPWRRYGVIIIPPPTDLAPRIVAAMSYDCKMLVDSSMKQSARAFSRDDANLQEMVYTRKMGWSRIEHVDKQSHMRQYEGKRQADLIAAQAKCALLGRLQGSLVHVVGGDCAVREFTSSNSTDVKVFSLTNLKLLHDTSDHSMIGMSMPITNVIDVIIPHKYKLNVLDDGGALVKVDHQKLKLNGGGTVWLTKFWWPLQPAMTRIFTCRRYLSVDMRQALGIFAEFRMFCEEHAEVLDPALLVKVTRMDEEFKLSYGDFK